MKAKEIKELKSEEIQQRLNEEAEELRKAHFQHAVGTLQNPSVIREKRRLIARLRTILQQREAAA